MPVENVQVLVYLFSRK